LIYISLDAANIQRAYIANNIVHGYPNMSKIVLVILNFQK